MPILSVLKVSPWLLLFQRDRSDVPTEAGTSAGGTTVGAPMPAFIVGNDKAVDRFLKGGKSAFMDFINENKQSLKAMLGQ